MNRPLPWTKTLLFVGVLCSLLGALLPPRNAIAAATDYLTLDNFQNGETLTYDLPLFKGTAPGSTWVQVASGGTSLRYAVHDGRWRGFFPLVPGANPLVLSTSAGPEYSFSLTYQPGSGSLRVRMVYILGSDSAGSFDAPAGALNTSAAALARLQLSGRILQSMTAELLYEKGQPRRTFQLLTDHAGNPVADAVRVDRPVSQLRGMTGIDLWNYFYGQLGHLPNRNSVIDMAVMADTHFDPESGTLQEHTALGGGRLALFGGSTLYGFPDAVEEIEDHFTDPTPVEPTLNPEWGRAKAYWASYTTSLGAMLHEMGHCFGLPHPDVAQPGDIMGRGIDYLNRLAVTEEPGHGAIDPTLDILPRWTDSDAVTLDRNARFSLAESSGSGGPQLLPGRLTASTSTIIVMVEAAHSTTLEQSIQIHITWPGVTWTAQAETGASLVMSLDQTQGGPGDTLTVRLDSSPYSLGTYTNQITVTASDSTIQGSPLLIPVRLVVVDSLWQTYLPNVIR